MRISAILLGVGLGGFFDGILLHQILQWHHLVSLVPGVDIRGLVLWDGLFHLLMYALALAGLWGLWRLWRQGAPAPLAAPLLLGFGLWHVLDAVLSHWTLGIHRVRDAAANPLAWDLGWLAAFGLLPLALGLLLRGRGPGASGPTLAALALLALASGAWAARPPAGATGLPPGQVALVFRPGAGLPAVLAALDAANARLVAGDPHRGVVVVDAPGASRWTFLRHGAIVAGGADLPAGCLAWSRA